MARRLAGVDEVGRGCWAGPLAAGAVILGQPIGGLKDSKKLTKNQRQGLAKLIEEKAVYAGLGWASPAEVDELGLSRATALAMRRALRRMDCEYDEIIIDGKFNFLADNPKCRAVVRADDSVPAVSAASIIAKAARDNYMAKLAQRFPCYGFEKHVGYGTKQHIQMLKKHGVCEIHRLSYKPVEALG
jgi:ribonuclease HII